MASRQVGSNLIPELTFGRLSHPDYDPDDDVVVLVMAHREH